MKFIMQGDQYKIGFRFKQGKNYLTTNELADARIMIGDTVKTYTDDQVTYEDDWWYYPVTEEETFALSKTEVRAQARLVFHSGDVVGIPLGKIKVIPSKDKGDAIDG